MWNRRLSIQTRLSWPSMSLAVLVSALYLLALVSTIFSLEGPTRFGIRVDPVQEDMASITWVTPGSAAWDAGIRRGDSLLKVDGRSVAEIVPLAEVDKGKTFTFLRRGSQEPLQVGFSEGGFTYNLVHGGWKLSFWVMGFMFFLSGIVVFARSTERNTSFWFLLTVLAAAFALTVAPATIMTRTWALVVEFLSLALGPTAFLFLALSLSSSVRSGWKYPETLRVIPLLFFGVLCILHAVSFTTVPGAYHAAKSSLFAWLATGHASALFVLLQTERRALSTDLRLGIRAFFIGSCIGLAPLLFLSLLPYLFTSRYYIPPEMTVLATSLVPVFLAYAVLRHQMLGVQRLGRIGLVHTLSAIALAIGIGVSLSILGVIRGDDPLFGTAHQQMLVVLLFVGVSVVAFPMLRYVSEWVIQKALFGAHPDLPERLASISRELAAVNTLPEVASYLARELESSLRLESALIFAGASPNDLRLVAHSGSQANSIARVAQAYLKGGNHNASREVTRVFLGGDPVVLAPLWADQRYVGQLVIGPRRGGASFTADQLDCIRPVGAAAALSFQKCLLAEELRQKADELERTRAELQERKAELERFSRRLLLAQEEERVRISTDVHDGALQNLVRLIRKLEQIGARSEVEEAKSIVAELRRVISGLRPAVLDDLGLIAALRWLCSRTAQESGMDVRFRNLNVDEQRRLEPTVEANLFRITQSALSNAVRHSEGTAVFVGLSMEHRRLELVVEDNGKGFDPGQFHHGRNVDHIGLLGIQQRLQDIGGEFQIDSEPGEGTRITVRVPVPLPMSDRGGEHRD